MCVDLSISGLLTDQNTDQMNIVFDHAIDVANEVGILKYS